jgi:hypothetical protein
MEWQLVSENFLVCFSNIRVTLQLEITILKNNNNNLSGRWSKSYQKYVFLVTARKEKRQTYMQVNIFYIHYETWRVGRQKL